MNYFDERMFNPAYCNISYYQQLSYNMQQSEHVGRLVNSFSDMLDQVEKMDTYHQKQAFELCLAELAKRGKLW